MTKSQQLQPLLPVLKPKKQRKLMSKHQAMKLQVNHLSLPMIKKLPWQQPLPFVVLLGGKINAELEHETRADTTNGPGLPMGERGAFVADTTPETKPEH